MENPLDFDPSTLTRKHSGIYFTSQHLLECRSMLSMHCTLPWHVLALQIRRFEMPPLCKLAMWHFCVRRKGHSTCWILPNLENHTCSSHPHMCASITQCDSPAVSRPLYIEAIMCGVESMCLLRPSSVHMYIFATINMSFEAV